jgi:acyl-CoA thioester hydrolase
VRHVYECPLRRTDVRDGGCVDQILHADYLQEARLDLLRRHPGIPAPRPDEGLVVVRTVIELLAPLRLADAPLRVSLWPTQVRGASFTLGYQLSTGADAAAVVHARATTLLTPFDFTAQRPRRLTPSERETLLADLEEPPVSAPAGEARPWSGGSRTDVWVRFSDVDLLGHVNNVRYLEYAQEAIADLIADVIGGGVGDSEGGGRGGEVRPGAALGLARIEVDYLGQMELRAEPYAAWCRVAAVDPSGVTFEAEIRDDERTMARCRVVQVGLGPHGEPTPLPERLRAAFAEAIVS